MKSKRSKVTYTDKDLLILLLKETFERDLEAFIKLLPKVPNDWTLTVIQEEKGQKELIVNRPSTKSR
jgi:hypothetical protein